MKKVIVIICLFTSVLAKAQVCIPDLDLLAEFKSTKTAILIDNTRKVKSSTDLKNIIPQAWDVTPLIIDKEAALVKYKKPGYSVLRVERIEKEINKDGNSIYAGTSTVVYNYLRLVLFKEDKKGKIEEELVGCVIIGDNIKMTDGLFEIYIKMLNCALKKGQRLPLYLKSSVDQKITDLKSQTLYIPGYAFNTLRQNSESKAKRKDSDKFLKRYEFKAQIEEQQNIDKRILNNENVYFLLYIYYGLGVHCTSVVNASTGEIIYRHAPKAYEPDPTMNPNDLDKLSSTIKKGEVSGSDDDKDE